MYSVCSKGSCKLKREKTKINCKVEVLSYNFNNFIRIVFFLNSRQELSCKRMKFQIKFRSYNMAII